MAKSSELWPVPNAVLNSRELVRAFTIASDAVISQNTENTWNLNYWTIGSTSIPTPMQCAAGAGIYSASLMFGGLNGTVSTQTVKITTGASGALNTGRQQLGGSGIQNAALSFGGDTAAGGGGSFSAVTETFNGTAWTNVATPALTARSTLAGSGIQGATAAFGGKNGSVVLATTELFNGSVWSASGAMNTARGTLVGTGTQGAGLSTGGFNFAGAEQTAVESFNGATWTILTPLVIAQGASAGVGTLNATTMFGGTRGGVLGVETCMNYNGTTWSVIASMIVTRKSIAGTGCASQAWALCGYGNNYGTLGVLSVGEYYRGRVGSVVYNLASVSSSGLYTYTSTASSINLVKETTGISELDSFNWYSNSIEDGYLTTLGRKESSSNYDMLNLGAWLVGLSMPAALFHATGLGNQNSMVSIGGITSSGSGVTSSVSGYRNGSWYTSSVALSVSTRGAAGAGVPQAGLYFGGTSSTQIPSSANGSSNVCCIILDVHASTSSSGNLPVSYYSQAGCGHSFAAMSVGGQTKNTTFTYYHDTYLFNGYAWSTGGDMSAIKGEMGLVGRPTAAIVFGGYNGLYVNVSEKFNGSVWASDSNYPQSIYALSGSGTSCNTATGHGGTISGPNTISSCCRYNGSSWAVMAALGTGSSYHSATSLTGFPMIAGGLANGPTYLQLSQLYRVGFPTFNTLPSSVSSTVPML